MFSNARYVIQHNVRNISCVFRIYIDIGTEILWDGV